MFVNNCKMTESDLSIRHPRTKGILGIRHSRVECTVCDITGIYLSFGMAYFFHSIMEKIMVRPRNSKFL